MNKKTLIGWLDAATFLLAITTDAITPDNIAKNLTIPHEKYVLENGLQVILSEDKSTPFIAVNLWYGVGAVNEEAHKTGQAHLFEHLMFEGSRHVKASEHFKLLENAGAFDLNASTGFDRTNYYQTVPKNQLELALSLESSRMFFLVINQEKLDEQRAVVRREREQRVENTAYGMANQKLWEAIFPKNHPFYGRVIGSHEDLVNASLKDVQGFYDVHYGPQNATLTLVGDFDKAQAKALIQKYFATLPKQTIAPAPHIPDAVIKEQEMVRVDEKLGKLPLVRIDYLTPALFQPGDAELDILSHILTGGEFGRLTKALTRDKKWASSVSAYQQSMDHTSVFTIDVVLIPGADENAVIKEVDDILAGLVSKPPQTDEINRARNSILKNQLFSLQSLGGSAELLQTYNRFAKTPDFLKQDIERYQKIQSEDLKNSVMRYIPPKKARKILIAKPMAAVVAAKGK